MPESILKKSTNYVQLYVYNTGNSEVPTEFHVWCSLASIAACVQDRVFFEKFKGEKIYPNLYTMLIGPSGCGKGQAIGTMQRILAAAPRINMYAGELTGESLLKKLSRMSLEPEKDANKTGARIFIIQEELASSAGTPLTAESLIKRLVENWKPDTIIKQKETVTSGASAITGGYCINWCSGTTISWLSRTITADFYQGGFTRRVIPIIGEYNPNKRKYMPDMPYDYNEVFDHLQKRAYDLSYLKGEAKLSNEAREIDQEWYENRPSPNVTDDDAMAVWKGQHDLVYKIALCLMLADNPNDLIITIKHIQDAQKLSNVILKNMPTVLASAKAGSSTELRGYPGLEKLLKESGRAGVFYNRVLQWGAGQGIPAKRMDELLAQLRLEGKIKAVSGLAKGTVIYKWQFKTIPTMH